MDNPPRGPSLLLKFLALAARWSFGLLLAAWLLFLGVWAVLHGLIVPRIGELRPQIEARVSSALGVPVQIGAVMARSTGLIPSFELTDVRLFDPAGPQALHLPRVLAALSPRSLWHLGLEQLYIERPQLQIRRAGDGRIFVAGLDFSRQQDTEGRAADWFFTQTEFVIRDGEIEWIDEQRGTPPLALHQVDLVVRNGARSHALRLDATPPPAWGQRFSVQGQFRQPLLSTHAGRWQDWDGQLHAAFERIDVAELGRYLPHGLSQLQGEGALRAWVDVRHGAVTAATTDVALQAVRVQVAERPALQLARLGGRLGGRWLNGGLEVSTENLAFDMDDDLHWPGGNLRLLLQTDARSGGPRGELQADRLDLAALARIAARLAPDEVVSQWLVERAPQGLVERVQASWEGALPAPPRFQARGRVSGLALAAVPVATPAPALTPGASPSAPAVTPSAYLAQLPGVRGAEVDFDLSQAAGRAHVVLRDGALLWPGLLDEPALGLQHLSTDVQWQVDGARVAVQLPNLRLRQDGAQGEAQLRWHNGATPEQSGPAHGPGVLDLQAGVDQIDVRQLHRYWPQAMDADLRHYLRQAIPQGQVTQARLRLRGDLREWPFREARQGEFRVTLGVRNATFGYVPRSLQAADALPWPALTQFNGDLLIEHDALSLKNVNARVAGGRSLRLTPAEGRIASLWQTPVVTVQAQLQGPLAEMLGQVVNASPLRDMTDRALADSSASGAADAQFRLVLPLHELDKTSVQGRVTLAGNDFQFTPALPRLTRARGVVHFTEHGFAISGAQARALGGEVRLEGGSIAVPGAGPGGSARPAPLPTLRVQGLATAEGLRQAAELGVLARLGQQASGSTSYSYTMGWRQGRPEWQFSSSLQGLGLDLPAPLAKPAETALPLRIEMQPLAGQAGRAQLALELGRALSARYIQDVEAAPARVVRGTVRVGTATEVPMPAEGVLGQLMLDQLDLDAWSALLRPALATPTAGAGVAGSASAGLDFLPDSVAGRVAGLSWQGQHLHQVVLGASREGALWRANLDASELSGYVEYRPAGAVGAGRLYARLARLVLAQSNSSEVERLLDAQPESIPALDVVIGELELRGKRLGRLEVEALNRGAREWRLNKLNLSLPEARLSATGRWSPPIDLTPVASTAAPARTAAPAPDRRRTLMDFRLELVDAGALLGRLGMADVIRLGQGRMEGQVSWLGSPLSIDYPTLSGVFGVNVENGQFLKADPGMAKLLGVLSLQSLPRRLTLDFRDVFSEGFAFDFVRGDVRIEHGMARTNNLQMKGVNAAVLMEGQADIAHETQDLKVVVVPEINAGTASLIATWINPVAGLSSFLAQLFLRQPLIESNTQEFHIDGSWTDPRVTRVAHRPAPAAAPVPVAPSTPLTEEPAR